MSFTPNRVNSSGHPVAQAIDDINSPEHDAIATALVTDTPISQGLAAAISTPGDPVRDAVETVSGNVRLVGYDDFTNAPDGALAGRLPIVGPAWVTAGGSLPRIENGSMLNPVSGYAVLQLAEKANYLEAIGVFGGTGTDASNTLAWADSPFALANLFHLIYGPGGFTLTVRQDETAFYAVHGGNWEVPCRVDDATPYRVGVFLRGDSCTIIGPHGEVYSARDPRISVVSDTDTVFWQPTNHSGSSWSRLLSVRALRYVDTDLASSSVVNPMDIALIGRFDNGRGDVVGARKNFQEVTIGSGEINSGYPALTLGPKEIRTHLTADVAIGATTITVDRMMRAATATIDGGDNAEGVTITGNPNPLPGYGYPYVMTLTAPTTKAHPAGTVVIQSGLTQVSISYNPLGGVPITLSTSTTFSGDIYRDQVKVVSTRRTGWAAATGTATRTTFDASTVTTAELAQRMKALLDDLIAHGLIGA